MAEVTRATREDIPALVRLLGLLFEQEAEFEPDVRKQERGLGLLLDSPGQAAIFVARDGDEVVGMMTLLFTFSTVEGGRACWLEDMIVAPGHQGAGVGSELIAHAIEYARARGVLRITLLTDPDNEGAIHFYERHGFVHSGMRPLRLNL
jgi:ribosomal protein S18 acetylase RimI-like enzyme